MTQRSTVYIVDDDPGLLHVLESLFRARGLDVEVFATIDDFLARPRAGGPGCLVLDARRAGPVADALQAALFERRIDLPLVFVTARDRSSFTLRAIGLGRGGQPELDTHGVLAAKASRVLGELERGGARAESGEHFLGRLGHLTERELQVAVLVVEGTTNKQIAGKLGISAETVKVHRARVMRKLAAGSLVELVQLWERSNGPATHDRGKTTPTSMGSPRKRHGITRRGDSIAREGPASITRS